MTRVNQLQAHLVTGPNMLTELNVVETQDLRGQEFSCRQERILAENYSS